MFSLLLLRLDVFLLLHQTIPHRPLERVKVAAVGDESARVEVDDVGADAVEEMPCVGNDEQRLRPFL